MPASWIQETAPQRAPGTLDVRPTFLGERHAPSRRGRIDGIDLENFSLGNLARSLGRGLAANLKGMLPPEALARRIRMVGSGNGLRRNPMLRKCVEEVFGMTVDLTPAYAAAGATQVVRTIGLFGGEPAIGGQRVTIEDEVQLKEPGKLWWFLHTEAEVALSDGGRRATLTQDGKALTVYLVAPDIAGFTVMDAAPLATSPNPEGQNPNKGVRKLAIHLSKVEGVTLRVALSPGSAK